MSGARSDGRRQASLPHLSRRDTEKRARDTAEWAATHVRPERWYHPREELVFEGSSCVEPGSRWQAGTTNFCQGTARSVLPCMTGCRPQGLDSDERWWCNCGKRQRAITCLLSVEPGLLRSGGCGRGLGGTAPASTRGRRWLGGYGGRAVLEYLGDTKGGCRVSPGRARVDEGRDEEKVPGSEGGESGLGPP